MNNKITDTTDSAQVVDHFDRQMGALHGLPDVAQTKNSTIRHVPPFGVDSQLYIVQTFRQKDVGDTIFLEHVSKNGTTRIVIPPAVSAAIARQRDQLTTKVRSKAAKQVAQDRKDQGLQPGFMKNRQAS